MHSRIVALSLLALALAASAITCGTVDGHRHPQTGALVGHFASGKYPYCSGTLIAPTVFPTAARCGLGESRSYVLRRFRRPNFIGAGSSEATIVAGTTITGEALCKATNVIYRLNTPSARAFLSAFVALP